MGSPFQEGVRKGDDIAPALWWPQDDEERQAIREFRREIKEQQDRRRSDVGTQRKQER